MVPGISLANKSQLLFGFAVVVILIGALAVPWVRTSLVLEEVQREEAGRLADAWLSARLAGGGAIGLLAERDEQDPPAPPDPDGAAEPPAPPPPLRIRFVRVLSGDVADADPFVSATFQRFAEDAAPGDGHGVVEDRPGGAVYRYARPVYAGELVGAPDDDAERGALIGMVLVERPTRFVEGQRLRLRVFIIAAGLFAGLLAILVFYFILTKLILSPVRRLRETVETVEAGDLSIRSEIKTGDEFEQLAEAFNTMLERVQQSQAQLEAINSSLDLKLDALAEDNLGLYESNRLKNEFLANVSHELKTPLNSIIGFAELLEELATREADADPKRQRYLGNILTSGRALLDLINDLLDLAKIEAGRMEVTTEPTSVADLLEGLIQVMRPQAEAKSITITSEVGSRIPIVETDPGKLQQILYNFLSNAIKFTPGDGEVKVTADRVTRSDGELGVRIAVSDTGPGISEDMQDVVFEKFRQADAGHTRAHTGTGLGLAICRELAEMLGASVSFVSDPGRGATFFVDVPLKRVPDRPQPLMG